MANDSGVAITTRFQAVYGHRQGMLDGPAESPFPREHGRSADSCHRAPFGKASRVSAEGNHPVTPAIARLSSPIDPAAVLWRVRPVVVDSIKRTSGWPCPHVGQKRLETVSPSLAHRDAASTVAMKGGIFCIGTTPFCAVPATPFGGSGEAMKNFRHSYDHIRVVTK